MRKWMTLLLAFFLCGCTAREDPMQEVLALRGKVLSSDCTFRCSITADYGDTLESFVLECESDTDGELDFTVISPESISGISGSVDGEEGALSFDGAVLAFPVLDQAEISPVSAPWILMQTLRKGYITSAARTESGLHICLDDSYADDALQLEIWTDGSGNPIAGEISLQGRRIVSMQIEGFTYV